MKPYYETKNVRLYCGDCFDVLSFLPLSYFDAIVTDPPYATAGGNSNGRASGEDTQFWQFWFTRVWNETVKHCQQNAFALIHCDWRMLGALCASISQGIDRMTTSSWRASQVLTWNRQHIGMGSPYRNSTENIVFCRGPNWKRKADFPRDIGTVVEYFWAYGSHRFHSAEKPGGLYNKLLTPHGPKAILDLFAGSGPVLRYCDQNDIDAVGIERDERNCEQAAIRLSEPKQEKLLEV